MPPNDLAGVLFLRHGGSLRAFTDPVQNPRPFRSDRNGHDPRHEGGIALIDFVDGFGPDNPKAAEPSDRTASCLTHRGRAAF
ncbi:MAG: hypothetical protein JWQ36_2066 [Enterovirga sp.]|jgi:hypothetical protein|nr:hypothetical protein [Enterovirga sp.]